MLGTRVVNALLLARDEQFLAGDALGAVILDVVGDNLT